MQARRLAAAAASIAAVSLIPTAAAAGPASEASRANPVFELRPDRRMCPSPACGGYWASLVNGGKATCLDGIARGACYVAAVDLSTLAPPARSRARAALAAGRALVEGSFTRPTSGPDPRFASLTATLVWIESGTGETRGIVYRVVDAGVRCVRAPCFSLRATALNASRSVTLSGLDLTRSGATGAIVVRAHAVLGHGGVLAVGAIRPDGKIGATGRVLAAANIWLPAA